MGALNFVDQIHHTRRVYANHKRLIDIQQQYDDAADPVNRAVYAEQAGFVIEHQIEHLAASWLARALTSLPLDGLRADCVDWLARGEQAWAEAAGGGCPDCARNVFHSRHTTVAERNAEITALKAKLRAVKPTPPSRDERTGGFQR